MRLGLHREVSGTSSCKLPVVKVSPRITPIFLLPFRRFSARRARQNEQNDMKVFAEATLGNTVDNSKRAGFIKYDRNVLRFQAVWDDRESLYGDIQRFEVSTLDLFLMLLSTDQGVSTCPSVTGHLRCARLVRDVHSRAVVWSLGVSQRPDPTQRRSLVGQTRAECVLCFGFKEAFPPIAS